MLAHRFVWSAVFLLVILAAARRLGDLRRLSARTWLQLLAASALISINWGIYIYAVNTATSSTPRSATSSTRWSPWRWGW